ncbi:MAG: hypothetical protein COB20_11950 [SAR86 cluster bacterium]|uniref:AsmA domain-containing protein n=1 Tax=SAR86 cluster bacterium TaxID=2030880 RepID=A0A2A4WZH1_9GAMM|nr:MAG: hypothetical protein COB20_11950 [SAR86 cluster bacterium]
MIKKILISVVFLLLLVGGGLFFYLDSIVKSGIEVVGSSVLGTAVTVDSVSLSPLSGQGSISGLRVENPEGFDSQYAFELDSVLININVNSVFTDAAEIESIIIMQPIITYETKITSDNIRTLLDNLSEGGSASSDPEASDDSGQQIIIREFRMVDAQLNFVSAIVSAPITLADIEIRDIGAENGTASAANAVRVVLQELVTSILGADLPSLDELRESVEDRIQDGAQRVEEAVEDLGGRLRSILN